MCEPAAECLLPPPEEPEPLGCKPPHWPPPLARRSPQSPSKLGRFGAPRAVVPRCAGVISGYDSAQLSLIAWNIAIRFGTGMPGWMLCIAAKTNPPPSLKMSIRSRTSR